MRKYLESVARILSRESDYNRIYFFLKTVSLWKSFHSFRINAGQSFNFFIDYLANLGLPQRHSNLPFLIFFRSMVKKICLSLLKRHCRTNYPEIVMEDLCILYDFSRIKIILLVWIMVFFFMSWLFFLSMLDNLWRDQSYSHKKLI